MNNLQRQHRNNFFLLNNSCYFDKVAHCLRVVFASCVCTLFARCVCTLFARCVCALFAHCLRVVFVVCCCGVLGCVVFVVLLLWCVELRCVCGVLKNAMFAF
jgi:hypothetical protein